MNFLDEIRKQPKHIREIMFALCVITTISLIGMIWFRSFEKDMFVLLNPSQEVQDKFFAERSQRTPTVYANVTKAFVNMRASVYDAMGFLKDYNSNQVDVDPEYKGEARKLPISGDR